MRRAVILALGILTGCSRPKPPTLTPESATVTSVGPGGIGLQVQVAVDNPNEVDLKARSLTAKMVLDGKLDMGTTTIANPVVFPARKSSKLAVPVTMKWNDLPTVLMLATSNRTIPYEVDGSVSLGGDLVNVDLPFRLQGAITHDQLVQATVSSLPRLLP